MEKAREFQKNMGSRKMVQMNPFAGKYRDADIENGPVDTAGEGGWEKLGDSTDL